MDDLYDYRRELSAEKYAAAQFMDSVIEAAKNVPMYIFMDRQQWDDPVVALAYKLFQDSYQEEGN